MKLDQDSLNYIVSIVRTAKSLGMESLIIEPGRIRAADTDIGRCIIHTKDVQELPFGSVGITRLDVFLDRYELASMTDGMHLEYATRGEHPDKRIKEDKDAMYALSLLFKGKGLKLDFRPSNPLVVRSPITMNDRQKYRITITESLVQFLTKGKGALGTDQFTLVLNDQGASIEMIDINNDKMSFLFSDTVENIIAGDNTVTNLAKNFPIAYALPVFKNNIGSPMYVSERTGYLEVVVNNLNTLILPRV